MSERSRLNRPHGFRRGKTTPLGVRKKGGGRSQLHWVPKESVRRFTSKTLLKRDLGLLNERTKTQKKKPNETEGNKFRVDAEGAGKKSGEIKKDFRYLDWWVWGLERKKQQKVGYEERKREEKNTHSYKRKGGRFSVDLRQVGISIAHKACRRRRWSAWKR